MGKLNVDLFNEGRPIFGLPFLFKKFRERCLKNKRKRISGKE
jgi:hypothetical protein